MSNVIYFCVPKAKHRHKFFNELQQWKADGMESYYNWDLSPIINFESKELERKMKTEP